MLLQIAEALPREVQGILACCNPIPPLVRANLLELHQIILRAKEQPLEKVYFFSKLIMVCCTNFFNCQPILKEETRGRGSTKQMHKINVDSPLHCPHDLTKSTEFRDDLPTLLNKKENILNFASSLNLEQTTSTISFFNDPENVNNYEIDEATSAKLKNLKFLGPYDRYKLVKPFIEAEEAKAAAESKAEGDSSNIKVEEKDRSIEERISEVSLRLCGPFIIKLSFLLKYCWVKV